MLYFGFPFGGIMARRSFLRQLVTLPFIGVASSLAPHPLHVRGSVARSDGRQM